MPGPAPAAGRRCTTGESMTTASAPTGSPATTGSGPAISSGSATGPDRPRYDPSATIGTTGTGPVTGAIAPVASPVSASGASARAAPAAATGTAAVGRSTADAAGAPVVSGMADRRDGCGASRRTHRAEKPDGHRDQASDHHRHLGVGRPAVAASPTLAVRARHPRRHHRGRGRRGRRRRAGGRRGLGGGGRCRVVVVVRGRVVVVVRGTVVVVRGIDVVVVDAVVLVVVDGWSLVDVVVVVVEPGRLPATRAEERRPRPARRHRPRRAQPPCGLGGVSTAWARAAFRGQGGRQRTPRRRPQDGHPTSAGPPDRAITPGEQGRSRWSAHRWCAARAGPRHEGTSSRARRAICRSPMWDPPRAPSSSRVRRRCRCRRRTSVGDSEPGRPSRIEPGPPQQLVGEQVAETGQARLVHQPGLQRSAAPAQDAAELGGTDIARVGAQAFLVGIELHAAEASRVLHPQGPAAVEVHGEALPRRVSTVARVLQLVDGAAARRAPAHRSSRTADPSVGPSPPVSSRSSFPRRRSATKRRPTRALGHHRRGRAALEEPRIGRVDRDDATSERGGRGPPVDLDLEHLGHGDPRTLSWSRRPGRAPGRSRRPGRRGARGRPTPGWCPGRCRWLASSSGSEVDVGGRRRDGSRASRDRRARWPAGRSARASTNVRPASSPPAQVEGEQAAGQRHLALGQLVLRVRLEARVAHLGAPAGGPRANSASAPGVLGLLARGAPPACAGPAGRSWRRTARRWRPGARRSPRASRSARAARRPRRAWRRCGRRCALVAECTTRSTPWSSGRWTSGVAKVESTTVIGPGDGADLVEVDEVEPRVGRRLGEHQHGLAGHAPPRRTRPGSVPSTKVTSMPKRGHTVCSSSWVPA